jgi:hypothetical protein
VERTPKTAPRGAVLPPFHGHVDTTGLRNTYLTNLECEHRRVKSRNARSHGGKCGEKLSSKLNRGRERTRPGKKVSASALKKLPMAFAVTISGILGIPLVNLTGVRFVSSFSSYGRGRVVSQPMWSYCS